MSLFIKATNLSKFYQTTTVDTAISLTQALFRKSSKPLKTVKTKVAVDQVSFLIQEGDRLGIVGRNGAGKTTLLQMIAGLNLPSSGTISTYGKVTAVMTLGVGLREDLTGRENIYLEGEVQGKTRTEINQFIDEIIHFSDLDKFIDYPIRTYSTGMKSRLAFSMITHVEPEILIIDETLSAGDAAFSKKANQKIQEICSKGKIVILVSHSMAAIVNMCNRCFWMERGRIVMDGHPEDVTNAYIESVKQEDEAILFEKYHSLAVGQSFRIGCEVVNLRTSLPDANEPSHIFDVGDTMILRVQAHIIAPLKFPDLKLRITRRDGLVVEEICLSEIRPFTSNELVGPIAYDFVMQPIILSRNIYIFTCEILEQEEVVAMKSTIVEIRDLNNESGIKQPVLTHPLSIEVE